MAVGKKCLFNITMSRASDQRVEKFVHGYQTKLHLYYQETLKLTSNSRLSTTVHKKLKLYPSCAHPCWMLDDEYKNVALVKKPLK